MLHVLIRVVVVGCGRVGSELAMLLSKEGNEVAVIDKDRRVLQRLAMDWGGNSNILAARIAKETYQVPNVAARIYDPRRAEIYRRLGIPTVATVPWTVDQVMHRVLPERTVTQWSAPTGEVVVVERTLPGAWVGYRLDDLEVPGQTRIVALSRAGRSVLPKPGTIGQEADVLHLSVEAAAIGQLEERLVKGPRR